MIALSENLRAKLNSAANQPIDLYELYLDSGTVYFADQHITWNGNEYRGKVKSRSTIKRYEGGQFDNVSVTFSNVDRTIADLLLQTEIEGRKLIIRKIDRSVSDDSIVLFNGRMERVSCITEEEADIDAKALIGGIDFDVPSRCFSPFCPWEFGSFECGYAGSGPCDKSWARCSQFGNTARFGGFRFFPHSGTYQYKEVERQRFLLFFSRKKEKTVTATFNAVDDTPYDVPIPQIFGRVQIAGVDIEHEDQGSVTKALVAFCAGPIQAIYYLRANDSYITDWMPHFGQLGGPGGQTTDDQFPNSYPYSLLAYARVNIPSDVKTVDSAPDITAVVEGRGVRIFATDGTFQRWGWSDNPIFCTQEFLTLSLAQGGMGVPEDEVDSTHNAQEAVYCDEIIQNTTNDQKIYNPTNLPEGAAYERYRSTSVVDSDPTVDGPYSDYQPGVDDDTSTAPAAVPVRRFTMNVALASAEKAVDVLFKKLLPSFRGFITYSKEGKIQIRVEKPAKNSLATAATAAGVLQIPCSSPSQWSVGEKLIASPLTTNAEVLSVAAVGTDGLTFTAPTQNAHANGDELLHVEMAFDDSNIVGDFEYPLSDRQATTNRVTIKYVDAPAGFEERELRINDYAHQAKVHRVDNEDLDGSAIDSYFQAWRIGEWKRAKLRDLGKFCSLRADITATALEIGDVIAASAAEVGMVAVPFRVVEIGYRDDDEVELVAQLYSSAVYNDGAPQATVTVPVIISPTTPTAPKITALSGVDASALEKTDANYAARWQEDGGAVHVVVNATVSGTTPQQITLGTRKVGDNTTLIWHGLFDLSASPQVIPLGKEGSRTALFPPTSGAEQWELIAVRGLVGSNAAVPSGAVISLPFTVAAIPAPAAGDIQNAVISYTHEMTADGGYDFYFTIEFDYDAANAQIWFVRMTRQWGSYSAGVLTPGPSMSTMDITGVTVTGTTAVFSYVNLSGAPLCVGNWVKIAGMANSANNITAQIKALGDGTFTVENWHSGAASESGSSGSGQQVYDSAVQCSFTDFCPDTLARTPDPRFTWTPGSNHVVFRSDKPWHVPSAVFKDGTTNPWVWCKWGLYAGSRRGTTPPGGDWWDGPGGELSTVGTKTLEQCWQGNTLTFQIDEISTATVKKLNPKLISLGGSTPDWIIEALKGSRDGVNKQFLTTKIPATSAVTGKQILLLFRNGVAPTPFNPESAGGWSDDVNADFTVSKNKVTYAVPPNSDDYHFVAYPPDLAASVGGESDPLAKVELVYSSELIKPVNSSPGIYITGETETWTPHALTERRVTLSASLDLSTFSVNCSAGHTLNWGPPESSSDYAHARVSNLHLELTYASGRMEYRYAGTATVTCEGSGCSRDEFTTTGVAWTIWATRSMGDMPAVQWSNFA